jgi:hypothetical protein
MVSKTSRPRRPRKTQPENIPQPEATETPTSEPAETLTTETPTTEPAETPQSEPTAAGPRATLNLKNLSPAREADIADFLHAAFEADPSSPKGKAALRAAETAALRLARDLRKQAHVLGGEQAKVLERRAQESFYRAVLARELPRLAELLRRPRVDASTAIEPRDAPLTASLLPAEPTAPTSVQAEAGILSATVRWTRPPELVTTYSITPFIGANAQTPTPAAGTVEEATVFGLTAGTTYRFRLTASNPLGTSDPSAFSNEVTPTALPSSPVGQPLDLKLPAFSSDPALLIDSAAEAARGWVSDATRVGQKWRYEHLKAQALLAAREAMSYEEHIARLMSMAVAKVGTVEEIVNATLLQTFQSLQQSADFVTQASGAPEIESLLKPLGETAAQSLLLPRFFTWLVEKGPVKFWIGLFEAIICDLASVVPFFGGATSFGHTNKYLETAFNSNFDDVQDAIKAAANDILARLDGEVEQMIAPLRAATGEVIEGTRKAMADVFESFDVTLLMTPPKEIGHPDVPDVDPFADLYARLNAQVDGLAARVKAEITAAVQPLTNGTGAGLFKTIVITFLVLPILAFLVISLAGGPFSAALLAAAVLLAAEELLRLLVRWLAGPLLKKVDELNQRLLELVGQLQNFFAVQAELVRNQSPEIPLEILASELRQLRDFLPQAFLEEAAGLLAEARNVVLRTATQLGMAAEQALGQENATAFEAVRDDYATHLLPAPQLPGGTDAARLAGAVLLRDLGRLEERRTAITDGKELEFTHRLSLLKLLGGNALNFQQFLTSRELIVSLTERDLIDRMFPGVYRALIKEVRVTGVFGSLPVGGLVGGVPLTITHLGESRTRIKRSANPLAPPLALPDCFPKSAGSFSRAVVGSTPFFPFPFEDEPPVVMGIFRFPDPLAEQIRRVFDTLPPVTINNYVLGWFLFLILGHDDPNEAICARFRTALLEHLPEALARLATEKSCGLVDPTTLVAALRALLQDPKNGGIRLSESLLPVLIPPDASSRPNEFPDLFPASFGLANQLRAGIKVGDTVKLPGLVSVANEAWNAAAASFYRRIARWGDADLEEDPDPQVRSLGYARLVRRAPVEAMVFNLLPAGPALNLRAESLIASSDGPPFVPASSLQYRPFENRGIEGDLLLRLETLGDDLFNPLSNSLTDVLLDVTVRGCFDPDLARTVRASRSQTASGLNIASNLTATPALIGQPDSLVRVEAGASELRTVHYSLRAHRDKTLQVWRAAVLARPAQTAALVTLLAGKAMLGRDVPFNPLDPSVTNFTFEFNDSVPANNLASLQGLAGKLKVSPADLGFDASILTGGRTVLEEARLTSVGVAVIPMPEGVRGLGATDPPDPLNVQLQVTGALANVLPGFAVAAPLPERLKLTIPADTDEFPKLADLFAADVSPFIMLQLGGALAPTPRLYDVILSLSFRVPVLRVGTPITAIR